MGSAEATAVTHIECRNVRPFSAWRWYSSVRTTKRHSVFPPGAP